MARLGVLKPLRGTESSLANVVLEDGEIAFSYPSTGPGTGLGGIKMGDGVKTFSSLPWYITGEGSGPTPTPWEYDEGTNETALLNNIKHPEYETLGKIYYIQSYINTSSSSSSPTTGCEIAQDVPYKVIGINREGTVNTVDLMAMVGVNYFTWSNNYTSWSYGKYSTSNFYSWLPNTCATGYSVNIQAKMMNMTERWREATGNASGILTTRNTKCKLLNPYEVFGSSSTTYSDGNIGTVSDFTTYDYGQHYSDIFPNSITADNSRIIYHDKAMTTPCHWCWLNSWYGFVNNTYARSFDITPEGACYLGTVSNNYLAAAPVIRLSDNL